MIRCKLVEYVNPDATQTGARVDRAVSGDTLAMGRAAASKIYLPDPRVRMEHARIRRAEDGALYMDALAPVQLNGRPENTVRLAVGQQITVGPYEFIVEQIDDGADPTASRLTLSFALRPQADEGMRPIAPDGIVQGWLTRRRLAWVLSLAVLLFCALIPVWRAYDLQGAPRSEAALAHGGGTGALAGLRVFVGTHLGQLDNFWNPGTIASAHQGFGAECSSCHARPFERVADTSCTACHKRVGDHVRDPVVQHAAFEGQRCATCHKEHQGERSMRMVDAIGCEQCHSNLQAHAPQSRLANVSDFARDHPPFRLSVRTGAGAGEVQRIAQTSQMRNETGLKFPHDKHLSLEGIQSPQGPADTKGRVVMGCADCHRLDPSGTRYEPIRMARDCQGCHRLSVDPQAPERQVPHGEPAVVATAVREIFASLAVDRVPSRVVTVNSLLQRPGADPAATAVLPAGRFVQDRSRSTLAAMFELPNGVCLTCHEVRKDGPGSGPGAKAEVPWRVLPVVMTEHWLPQSRFSHAQHKNADCASCHQAETSKQSSQVLIPPLETCQTCHAGTKRDEDKVVSRCDSCHTFHTNKPENPIFRKPVVVSEKQ